MNISSTKPVATIIATYDGDNFVAHRILDVYRSYGFEARFVGWDRLNRFGGSRTEEGVTYQYIMHGWGYANRRLLIALPLWTYKIAGYVAHLRSDIIHAVDFDAALGVSIGLLIRKTPFLYDIQDNFGLRHPFPRPAAWAIEELDSWIIGRSNKTIVVGEERIVGKMQRYRNKIAIVPNCPPDIPPSPDFVPDPTRMTVAFIGRIAEARGVRILLDACRRLPWLRVLMAGNIDGEELERVIRDSPQVEYFGNLPQQQALSLLHKCDVAFSFYDPSTEICRRANGAKWYDAMMAGKCLLVNSEVLSADWILNEGIGYASPYGDIDAITERLRDLHNHREKIGESGARARALFEKQFNRAEMNRRLQRIIESATNSGPLVQI